MLRDVAQPGPGKPGAPPRMRSGQPLASLRQKNHQENGEPGTLAVRWLALTAGPGRRITR